VALPDSPAQLRAFCRHSGLQAIVEDSSIPASEGDTVVPLRQIKQARWTDSEPIIQLVHRHRAITSELEEYLQICVNEVVQNIEDHSGSSIGGIMSARYLSQERQVRVAIVDRGAGIRATLMDRYPDTTDENVLRRVLEGQFSALSRPNNAGLGLSSLGSMIECQRGSFVIVSLASMVVSKETRKFRTLPFSFPGTAVFFTLPLRDK
jgi:anti-sigma regulatory factor (Ser/Thr protein kinase)